MNLETLLQKQREEFRALYCTLCFEGDYHNDVDCLSYQHHYDCEIFLDKSSKEAYELGLNEDTIRYAMNVRSQAITDCIEVIEDLKSTAFQVCTNRTEEVGYKRGLNELKSKLSKLK